MEVWTEQEAEGTEGKFLCGMYVGGTKSPEE